MTHCLPSYIYNSHLVLPAPRPIRSPTLQLFTAKQSQYPVNLHLLCYDLATLLSLKCRAKYKELNMSI